MDKKSLIISIVALVIAVGACAYTIFATCPSCKKSADKSGEEARETETIEIAEGSIVYFQLDRVVKEYDMANDLTSVVESKMQNVQEQLATRQKKLQKDFDAFNEKWQKGLMTQTTAQAQAEKLDKQKAELEKWANTKQNEMLEEQQVTMNQIMDAIQTFVTAYNEDKGYAMILANQTAAPIMTANSGLDITDEIIAGLNEEYIKNKNKKD
ncbi:MAG: OmpH family outer membrane protein [Bacteroidales bacterium]|nr:OmpH family outer membrane protein [Bacteroidales bacterium]